MIPTVIHLYKQRPCRPKPKTAEWRKKSDNPDFAEASLSGAASSSSKPTKAANKQPTMRAPLKRETNQRAKEMMEDANAARKVYERMQKNIIQDFTSGMHVPMSHNSVTTSRHAAVHTRCHACGCAYCLDCRSHGEACQHGPCNCTSEMSDAFLPDSIGSADSPFDLVDLIKETMGKSAYRLAAF